MMRRIAIALAVVMLIPTVAHGADLVRIVRAKISAGDLATGAAYVEDYRRSTGLDEEYWNAVGWLARGAVLLGRPDQAGGWVEELRAGIPAEADGLITPFGARIEVESKLIAARDGRGEALRFLAEELARAKDPALRSRINKNVNLLSLEGERAPAIDHSDFVGVKARALSELEGKPVLLYLFAQWCGDCKAQSEPLARLWERYRETDLELVALTRYYGSVDGKDATRAEEKERVAKVWRETYPGLADVPVTIDTEAMVRYGGSATPTFVLVDRKGLVRLFTPTRLSEAELARRIDEVLAE